MVTRETGESGDDAYRINAKLVHVVLATLFGSILSVGGYMTIWAFNFARYQTSLDERVANVATRVSNIERDTREGILPIARERIEQLERRLREHEARNHSK